MLKRTLFIGVGRLVFSCSQEKACPFIKNKSAFNSALPGTAYKMS